MFNITTMSQGKDMGMDHIYLCKIVFNKYWGVGDNLDQKSSLRIRGYVMIHHFTLSTDLFHHRIIIYWPFQRHLANVAPVPSVSHPAGHHVVSCKEEKNKTNIRKIPPCFNLQKEKSDITRRKQLRNFSML